MTWSLQFKVKDKKVDPESIKVSGQMPDQEIAISGWENDTAKSASLSVNGVYITGSVSKS